MVHRELGHVRKQRSDKGLKRGKYQKHKTERKPRVDPVRAERKLGRDLLRTKEELENLATNPPQRLEKRFRDMKERRAAKRREMLERLAANRTCPICKLVKTKSKQWVVVNNNNLAMAICLSCFRKQRKE